VKNWLLVVLGVFLLVGSIVAFKAWQIADLIGFARQMEEAGMPPTAVATARAEKDEWQNVLRFVGTLRAVQGVTLTAEVGGVVATIDVENGAEVEAGQLLLSLDTAREKAELASAEARLRLTRLNLERTQGLLAKRIVAQSELDTAQAEFDEARAQVANLQAIIDKKIIRAPFAGRVGLRQVNLGQTVAAGDELIPLHQSDPIFVQFAVPQTRLKQIQLGEELLVSTDGLAEPVIGRVDAINPFIDETTRTAMVQGVLRNPGEVLRAGQFARVEVILPGANEILRIPSSAVTVEPFGASVFVVEETQNPPTVRQQFVQLGRFQGDFVEILKGLGEGDRVVSAGAFKLGPGMAVSINDAMQPEPSLEPELPNR
jgi:membrane fusion protein (multidrug efflux system)